jgi:hypothetical protein
VVAWGDNGIGQCDAPAQPPGLSFVEVAAGSGWTAGRIGPESRYAFLGAGCAGSMPAARLVPLDTPRIGATLQVTLDNLPVDVALLWTGSSTSTSAFGSLPFNVSSLGMPGCTAYASADAVTVLVGSGGRAAYRLTIPDLPALVGVRFHQQALVFDPGANALGAVLSDAATAVIGR